MVLENKVVLVVDQVVVQDQDLIMVLRYNQLNQEIQAHMVLVIMRQMVILIQVVVEALEEALVLLVLEVVSVEVKVAQEKHILSLMEQLLFSTLVVAQVDKVLQVNKLVVKVDKVVVVKVE